MSGESAREGVTRAVLAALPADEWRQLHDAPWPGRPDAVLDHVVVGPGGVFVIDTLVWPEVVEVRDGVLRRDGRRQDTRVSTTSDGATAVIEAISLDFRKVHAVLCFVSEDELAGRVAGVIIASTANVVAMLTSRPEVLTPEEVQATYALLSEKLVRPAPEPAAPRAGRRGLRRTAAKEAKAAPASQSDGPTGSPRKPRRFLKPLIGLATLVVGAAALALIVPNLQSMVMANVEPSSAELGDTVTIAGTSTRPELTATALAVQAPKAAKSTRASKGTRLMVVPVVLTNKGTTKWLSGSETKARLVDADGLTYPNDPTAKSVQACSLLPTEFKLRGGHEKRGCFVFRVPRKAEIVEVRLSVGFGDDDGARWEIP